MAFRAIFAVRVFAFVAILSFLVFMLEVNAGSFTLSLDGGRRIKGDTELLRNNTRVSPRPGTQQNRVCYPSKSPARGNITMYEVRDLMPPGRKGQARLISGGVNKTSICFLLMSSPYQAYNFTITLWGFRR